MSLKYHQISLRETFSHCQDMFIDDSPSFFQLLEEHFDISEFIPSVFYNAFYRSLGRKRLYPLTGFLSALILQKLFSIPTDSLLILFLSLCKELRSFCGFSKVPDAPLFTRFKQDFLPYIEIMFQRMVDFTEPICQTIDSSLAQILTFDTSGIEPYVNENNPKNLNSLIRKLKAFYKDSPSVDPYQMAYALMSSQSASCSDAKQMYINSHFRYADKFALLTNGLSIVRHNSFLTMMLSNPPIPNWISKRNPIPLTRINLSAMLPPLSLSFRITSPSILTSIPMFSSATPLSTLRIFTAPCSMTFLFPRPLFLITHAMKAPSKRSVTTNTVIPPALKILPSP